MSGATEFDDLLAEAEKHLTSGKAKEASKAAEIASDLFRESVDDASLADALLILGKARLKLQKYDDASKVFEEAIALHQAIANEAGRATALVGLAQAEYNRGLVQNAWSSVKAAFATSAIGVKDSEAACEVAALAGSTLGRAGEAVALAKAFLSVQRRTGKHEGFAGVAQAVVRACVIARDEVSALRIGKKACATLSAAGDVAGHVAILQFVADLHLQAHRAEQARLAAEEALELLRNSLGAIENPRKIVLDTIAARAWEMQGATDVQESVSGVKPCSLRCFSVEPARGEVSGVNWEQTIGKVTLTFPLDIDQASAEVAVQMSTYHLEVSVNGQKVPALCGAFLGFVLFDQSSWKLETNKTVMRSHGLNKIAEKPHLVIEVVKRNLKPWRELWHTNRHELAPPLSRTRFSWTMEMYEESRELEEQESHLRGLKRQLQPTDDSPSSDPTVFAPDDLCIGITLSQTDQKFVVGIHFDGEALRIAQQSIPIDDLFAADVAEDLLCIFLRGDAQNPILWAKLGGTVVPEEAKWQITTSDKFRSRQREVSTPAPVLEVTLTKGPGACCRWPVLFTDCWQHQLMLKNYSDLEELLQHLEADSSARKELAELPGDETLAIAQSSNDEGTAEDIETKNQRAAHKAELESFLLSAEQREEIETNLQEWREQRWEGIPGAKMIQRTNMGIQEPGFSAHVSAVVKSIVDRTGFDGPARWNPELGRFSYIN